MCYDSTHVEAVVNQIDGYTHDRSRHVAVPALFGTNQGRVTVCGAPLALLEPIAQTAGHPTRADQLKKRALAVS